MTLLADLYFRTKEFRDAFETVHAVAVTNPESPDVQTLLDQARQSFADLYLNGEADAMQPVEALTLYYDFREFTPPGARGDEMVRNLARRLVKVDLLSQAAELLNYQINNRLEGAAKAQIAADLAVISIADRKPEKALEALNASRMSGLPPSLERQRRVLEARALIDSGREDLALDLLSAMDGRDTDLLRIDAQWRAERYQESAELIERLYSEMPAGEALTSSARSNIVRAAVGFVLADDRIGLSRLRSKFGDRLADSPDWGVFNFVTGEVSITSDEFQQGCPADGGYRFARRFPQVLQRYLWAGWICGAGQGFAKRVGAEPAPRKKRLYADCAIRRRCVSPASRQDASDSDETLDQRAGDQIPAVDQHEEDQLERQGDHHRRQHHHAHRHQHRGHHHVDDDEGQKEQEADLEDAAQFGDHEGRHEDLQRQIGNGSWRRLAAEINRTARCPCRACWPP